MDEQGVQMRRKGEENHEQPEVSFIFRINQGGYDVGLQSEWHCSCLGPFFVVVKIHRSLLKLSPFSWRTAGGKGSGS